MAVGPKLWLTSRAIRSAKLPRIPRKGDDHHRQAAGPHVDQLPQALRQAGAKVDHGHRHVAPGLGVAACHGGDGAFVKPQNAVDIGVPVQRVEEKGLSRAGVVEKRISRPRPGVARR